MELASVFISACTFLQRKNLYFFFNTECCSLFFYPSAQFISGKRDELIRREEHGKWKFKEKNCRINSDPHFITLATILAEIEKKSCEVG